MFRQMLLLVNIYFMGFTNDPLGVVYLIHRMLHKVSFWDYVPRLTRRLQDYSFNSLATIITSFVCFFLLFNLEFVDLSCFDQVKCWFLWMCDVLFSGSYTYQLNIIFVQRSLIWLSEQPMIHFKFINLSLFKNALRRI